MSPIKKRKTRSNTVLSPTITRDTSVSTSAIHKNIGNNIHEIIETRYNKVNL
jgi:hypothetical protein